METEIEQSVHITRTPAPQIVDAAGAFGVMDRLRMRLQAAVRGRDEVIELILIALLADGHVLLEDYPGSGKTTLAKALGACDRRRRARRPIATFRRIQFTPDLLPSDVTGTTVFDPQHATVLLPARADLRPRRARRRDQPHLAQGAVGDARGDGREAGHRRQRHPQARRALLRHRHAEPARPRRHLPAARRAARSLPLQDPDEAHRSRRASSRCSPATRERQGLAERRPAARHAHRDPRRPRGHRAAVHVAPEVHECLVDIAGETARGPAGPPGRLDALARADDARRSRRAPLSRRRTTSPPTTSRRSRPYIFAHRLELAPGVDDVDALIGAAMAKPLERLARATMARMKRARLPAIAGVLLGLFALGDAPRAQRRSRCPRRTAAEARPTRSIGEEKYLTARTRAEEALRANPDFHRRPLRPRLGPSRGRGLAPARDEPPARGPPPLPRRYGRRRRRRRRARLYRDILLGLQETAGLMELYEEQLELLDAHDRLYEPDSRPASTRGR